jgi:hypothetical protein
MQAYRRACPEPVEGLVLSLSKGLSLWIENVYPQRAEWSCSIRHDTFPSDHRTNTFGVQGATPRGPTPRVGKLRLLIPRT